MGLKLCQLAYGLTLGNIEKRYLELKVKTKVSGQFATTKLATIESQIATGGYLT